MIIDLEAFRNKKESQKDRAAQASGQDLFAMGKSLLQLKVTLKGFHPPLWRRVLIPEDWNFLGLHQAIEKAFDWPHHEQHHFRFNYHKITVVPEHEMTQDRSEKFREECYASTDLPLPALLFEFQRGHYEHGSHPGLDHALEMEKIIPAQKESQYPCCTALRGRVAADGTRAMEQADELAKIDRRLANLIAVQQPFIYDNPYEWYLVECLHEMEDAKLRDMADQYEIKGFKTLARPKLIQKLEETIPQNLMQYLQQTDTVTAAHLLLLMIVESPFIAPFDLNHLFDPEARDPSLEMESEFLTTFGFAFDLADLDPNLLPSPIADDPKAYLPLLVMPADLRKHILAAIRDHELNPLFDALQEALQQHSESLDKDEAESDFPWDLK